MLELINHFSQLVTGIAVGTICLLFFYFIGLFVMPMKYAAGIFDNEYAFVFGAAIWAIWCWFCIGFGLALLPSSKVFFCAFSALFLARLRHFDFARVQEVIFGRAALQTFLSFAFFYCLSYYFCPPSVSREYLPVVIDFNNDVFNYANYTSYLLRLGPSNVHGLDYLGHTYSAAPAAYFFMAMLAMFFDHEPMRAAMPALHLAVSLIGCAVAAIARTAFRFTLPASILIGAILICGPFFRFVSGYYFLAQLVGWVVLLALFLRTARAVQTGSFQISWTTALSLFPYYVLLLFVYPVLFFMGFAANVALVLLVQAFSSNPISLPNTVRVMLRRASATVALLLIPAALAALLDIHHFVDMIGWLGVLSGGIFGWSLDLVSPWAILGVAGPIEIHGLALKAAWITFMLGFTILLYVCCVRFRGVFTAVGKALLLLTFLSFISYFAYFLRSGPSYQQWKFASYFPLMLSFTIVCAAGRAALVLSGPNARESGRMGVSSIVVACLVGALFVGADVRDYLRQPRRQPISANYADLAALQHMGTSNEIYVQMNSYRSTFFPVYFIRNKVLHLLSPSYYPMETISLDSITPESPLFIEGATCDSKHTDRSISIGRLGCVYFTQPTVAIDDRHPFNEGLQGIATTGLSHQEPWGRWSDANRVVLVISAATQDIARLHDGFVNFELIPYLPPGVASQHVRISVDQKTYEAALTAQGWISLPYASDDWSASRVRTLRVEFELPDAIAPRDVDKTSSDPRKLGVGFSALSITEKPLGRVLEVAFTSSQYRQGPAPGQ